MAMSCINAKGDTIIPCDNNRYNHMDESAICKKKLHGNRKFHFNKKIARGEAESYLYCCQVQFFPNCTLIRDVSTSLSSCNFFHVSGVRVLYGAR